VLRLLNGPPAITNYNSLLRIQRYWEIQFDAQEPPTNEEIHHFLDGVKFESGVDDVHGLIWLPPSIYKDDRYHRCADNILFSLIDKLGGLLEHDEIRELLNMTRDDGVSLVSKAARLFLVRGLKALVQHGALLGDDEAAITVFNLICRPGYIEKSFLDQQNQIRKLLIRAM
jgi:hypothetical protein